MSVYNAYVGHGAAAPYYSQPPQPFQQQQQQQQQQPQYPGYYNPQTYDENGFRNLYMQRLGALTVNSRPIIQDLSMLAQNNPHMARVVVECIENQINMSPPAFKLPLFYLLDSIAKNAFDPYATAFRDGIYGLFTRTYDAVDQPTKHKMREMMATWKNGAPNNRELFGPHVQSQIEQRVWGSTRLPTSSRVLTELDVVLVQKERAAQQNPYDELLPRHINALHELRKMVPTMGTDDLTATLTRLHEMARASVTPAQPPPAPQSMPTPYGQTSFPPAIPQLPFGYPPPPPVSSLHTVLHPPQQALPSVTPPPPTVNVQNIISLLSSITSLQPAKVPAVTAPGPIEISATTSVEDYEKAILQCKIKVTSNDIARTNPQILPFIYLSGSHQCNECGMRFPPSEDGKVKLRDHLDQHFRQNIKASDNVGRGFSRSWFVGRKNWIEDIPEHSLNKATRPSAKMSDKQKAQAEETLRKELESKYLIVPVGEEGKEARCGICMETIKIEYKTDEDGEGEWVWQNAVKVDNKIYHATCHHDWATSSFNRLRLEAAKNSRQATPEVQQRSAEGTPLRLKSDSPRTPPSRLAVIAGTKRKAATTAEVSKPASLSSKEGTPLLLKSEEDEPRIKRRAIQAS